MPYFKYLVWKCRNGTHFGQGDVNKKSGGVGLCGKWLLNPERLKAYEVEVWIRWS